MPTPTKNIYQFPVGALAHLEHALRSLEADVISYPVSFGADRDRDLLVFVAMPDADISELVRAFLSSRGIDPLVLEQATTEATT